jgi:hypothetical protein
MLYEMMRLERMENMEKKLKKKDEINEEWKRGKEEMLKRKELSK